MAERVAHDDFMLVQLRLSSEIRGQYHNWQWACFENNHMWVQLLPASPYFVLPTQCSDSSMVERRTENPDVLVRFQL